jgi:hypothetical protein
MNKDTVLYLSGITYNYYQEEFWESLRPEIGEAGNFVLDMGKKFRPNRSISRNGEWSIPFPQEVPPMFKAPVYDPNFNKTFTEVTDARANDIKKCINEKNDKFAIMFSGGLDSTLIMSALIRNLTVEETKNIAVCMNGQTLIENPYFYNTFIKDKFKLLDSSSNKYDDLIEMGYRPITGDEGDSIFGTMMGHDLMQSYPYYLDKVSADSRSYLESIRDKATTADVHWSKYEDLIIQHLGLEGNPEFGKSLYEKLSKNIATATVPIHSLHDFYWWFIFNIKYVSCATRITIMLNDRLHCKDIFENWALNWFNTDDYNRWSMVNNNNGEKIELSIGTYKMAARKYIYELDKNDWYFYFKLKIGSLGPNVIFNQDVSNVPVNRRPNARFGLDKDYNMLYIDDKETQDYIRYHLTNFKRDW